MKKLLVAAVLLLCCTGLSGCWEVSDGERAGTIVKFSHKGLIWPTWEGGIMLGSSNSGLTQTFSLDNNHRRGENLDLLVSKLKRAAETGERVKITYKQEFITAPWRSGDTYLVQDVVFVK